MGPEQRQSSRHRLPEDHRRGVRENTHRMVGNLVAPHDCTPAW